MACKQFALRLIEHYNRRVETHQVMTTQSKLNLPGLVLLFLVGLVQVANAQQRPLITEDVDIIPPGTVRIEAGLDFLQGAKFPASGLTGDLTRVGVIGISIGFSPNVEFKLKESHRIF